MVRRTDVRHISGGSFYSYAIEAKLTCGDGVWTLGAGFRQIGFRPLRRGA